MGKVFGVIRVLFGLQATESVKYQKLAQVSRVKPMTTGGLGFRAFVGLGL